MESLKEPLAKEPVAQSTHRQGNPGTGVS